MNDVTDPAEGQVSPKCGHKASMSGRVGIWQKIEVSTKRDTASPDRPVKSHSIILQALNRLSAL